VEGWILVGKRSVSRIQSAAGMGPVGEGVAALPVVDQAVPGGVEVVGEGVDGLIEGVLRAGVGEPVGDVGQRVHGRLAGHAEREAARDLFAQI
jgi:hypothetical protein